MTVPEACVDKFSSALVTPNVMKIPGIFWRALTWAVIACVFALSIYRARVQPIAHDEALAYEWYLDGGIYKALMFDPSNHVLFTFIAKIFVKVFGVTEFSLRAASLIGAAAYLTAVYFLCKELFGEALLLPVSVALLTWNPQVLDFMVAARGYILGLACLTGALYYLTKALERGNFNPDDKHWCWDCATASVLLALAVVSNLAYVFPVASLGLSFAVLALYDSRSVRGATAHALHVFSRYFIAPGVIVGSFLLWPFVIQFRPYQFQRSLRFASAALRDFFESSFLYKWTGDIYSPSLGAVPLEDASWQKRVCDLGIYVLLPLLFLLVLVVLIRVSRFRDARPKVNIGHCQLFGGAAVTSVALTFLLHVVLKVDYPMARFCLYEIPFFTLAAVLGLRELSLRFPRFYLGTFGLVIAAAVLTDYGLSVNTKYFRYNAYDVFSRQLFLTIANDARAQGLSDVRVGGTWWYEPEINFYRRRYHADWMKPYDVKDRSYFWQSPGALEPAEYNYYLFIPANDPGLDGPRVRTIFQDATTHLKVIALGKQSTE